MGSTRVSGFVVTSLHVKPFSMWQSLPQPSPLTVLPSSHSWPLSLSMARKRPSPHAVAQGPPPGGQTGSSRQKGEQPSPVVALPSSHCSEPSFFLSPHVVLAHVVGPVQPLAFGEVQSQPSGSATGRLSSRQIAL